MYISLFRCVANGFSFAKIFKVIMAYIVNSISHNYKHILVLFLRKVYKIIQEDKNKNKPKI